MINNISTYFFYLSIYNDYGIDAAYRLAMEYFQNIEDDDILGFLWGV